MSKLAQTSSKYIVKASMSASGIVEKPDIIGAIFGQTEGLLGSELDLRELQKTGRIGRIEVDVTSEKGISNAEIIIPSSLDATETALIAAALETIDRVGPCTSEIKIVGLEDSRLLKRDYIVDRAKELLQKMQNNGVHQKEITEEIRQEVRVSEITEYFKMPAGPEAESSTSVILVEGRADVINLLKNGIKNAVAIGGTSIKETVPELSKQKIITVFLDGDRGGDLILKELIQVADLDYVARAPDGKEVEDLTQKEIFKALREKLESSKVTENSKKKSTHKSSINLSEVEKNLFTEITNDLIGTRAISIIDKDLKVLGRLPLNADFSMLPEVSNVYAILFDGEIDNKFVDFAVDLGAKYLIGMSKEDSLKSSDVITLIRTDF